MHDKPQFSFSTAFSLGWTAMSAHYWPLVGVLVIQFLVNVAIGITTNIWQSLEPCSGSMVSLGLNVFVNIPFAVGGLYVGLMAARGRPPAVAMLFVGFKRYWPVVGVGVVVWLITMAAMIIPFGIIFGGAMLAGIAGSASGAGAGAGVGIGILLLVGGILTAMAVGLLLGSRLMLAPLICVDNTDRPGVIESITRSWRVTSEYRWLTLVGLSIVLGLITIACLVMLVLPVIFLAMPLAAAVIGAAASLLIGDRVGECRACGFPVIGLPGGTCPECGGQIETE